MLDTFVDHTYIISQEDTEMDQDKQVNELIDVLSEMPLHALDIFDKYIELLHAQTPKEAPGLNAVYLMMQLHILCARTNIEEKINA